MQLQENWWFSKFHLEMAANPVCTVEDDYIFTSCHDFISYSNLEYHVSNSIPKWILKNQAVDCERRRPKENSKIIDDRFVQSPKREKIVYVTTHDLFIVMTHPWYQKPPLCTRNRQCLMYWVVLSLLWFYCYLKDHKDQLEGLVKRCWIQVADQDVRTNSILLTVYKDSRIHCPSSTR